MSGELEIYKKARDALDNISPSICLAKWLQVTMHLQNGRTHSCHHPGTHHIPLAELKIDKKSLHFTEYKKKQQEAMLMGKRPTECQYCWNVEDLGEEFYSDRIIKSSDTNNGAGIERIESFINELNSGTPVLPSYVEVSFSNVCNFKCSYCSPVHSSKWVSEIKNHGPYRLTDRDHNGLEWYIQNKEMPIHHTEYNPYVTAFWEWWPELVTGLKVFRITGGEPLLDENTFKVIDYFNTNKHENIEFSINSNLCVPSDKIEQYVKGMKSLLSNGNIRKHVLYTSVDGHGEQAEYGRHGLSYNEWITNVKYLLESIPELRIVIMCTANIFSITSIDKLLQDVLDIKLAYKNLQRKIPIVIDTSILRWPHHQNLSIVPIRYLDVLNKSLEFMLKHEEANGINLPYCGFFQFEIEKFKRMIEFAMSEPNPSEGINLTNSSRNFYLFVNEHDRRRGTSFTTTFPELVPFYDYCKKMNNDIITTDKV
jgi:organic radical activating enzyme